MRLSGTHSGADFCCVFDCSVAVEAALEGDLPGYLL